MGNNQSSKQARAREIVLEGFLAGKHRESGFREAVVEAHQDLMPEIEAEILKLEKVNAAVHGGSFSDEFRQERTGQRDAMTESGAGTGDSNPFGLSSASPPVTVPNYQLLRCVGRGGFGEVWLSRNVVTEDYHAVKILAEHCSLEIEGVRRYTEQVKTLAGLVPIKEVGKTDAGYYYVMPLADDVKGATAIRAIDRYEPKTLAWCYKNQPPLTIDEIVQLGTRLVGILEDLHETGLTHCDVKPANVIAVDGAWMLTDIGLMTRTDHFPTERGTLEFLPPERRCDHSADLYALAKTLFLLASGASIYRFEEFLQGDLKLQVESVKSDRLRVILGKACDPDADARYLAARDMRNDLNALSGLTVPASASAKPVPVPPLESDNRSSVKWWTVVVLFLLIVAIPVVIGVYGFPLRASKTSAPSEVGDDPREGSQLSGVSGGLEKIDLEIVDARVANLENHDSSKGRTMSYVTIRNQGTLPYDPKENEAQVVLTLPHLSQTRTSSWERSIPDLAPGEEKEIPIFNGNFQTDQANNKPSNRYEVVYQIEFAGTDRDSDESNNRRTGWYTPATATYDESETTADSSQR